MLGADDEADAARAEPILKTMGERIFRTGSLGSGHAMKALNNYVSAACFAATAEALLVGEQFGLDPSVIVDIMNVSTGKNFQTEMVMMKHVVERQFATGFKIGLLTKDIRIAADLADQLKVETPVLDLVYARWKDATRSRTSVGAAAASVTGVMPARRTWCSTAVLSPLNEKSGVPSRIFATLNSTARSSAPRASLSITGPPG